MFCSSDWQIKGRYDRIMTGGGGVLFYINSCVAPQDSDECWERKKFEADVHKKQGGEFNS